MSQQSDSNKRIGGKQAVATVPSSSYQEILVRPSARVACITLANPPLNIIDLPMMDELVAAMEEVEQRPDTCAIVFSGSPRAFSAGEEKAGVEGEVMQYFGLIWIFGKC